MFLCWTKIFLCFGFLMFSLGQLVFAQDTLQPLMSFAGSSAVWSVNGQRLLTSFNGPQDCQTDCPHQVRIVDVSGVEPTYPLWLEFDQHIRDVKWNADESLILVWTRAPRCNARCGDEFSVWDSATGEEVLSLTPRDELSVRGAVSVGWTGEFFYLTLLAHDSNWLFEYALIRVWNVEGEEIFMHEPQNAFGTRWNGDILLLGVAGENRLTLWNVRDNTQLWEFENQADNFPTILWHPDGDRFITLYTANGGTHIEIWNVSGELLDTLTITERGTIPSVIWNGDAPRLLFLTSSAVSIWDLESGEILFEYTGEVFYSASLNADHLLLFADTAVTVYDAQTFEVLLTLTPPQDDDMLEIGRGVVAWNVDRSLLLVGAPHEVNSTGREIVTVWNSEGEFVAFLGDMFFYDGMPTWSPTSNQLMGINYEEARIYIWELEG
jgi:hypothetical protein